MAKETDAITALAAEGLFDSAAPGAAERGELVAWLAARGASLEELREALRANALQELAVKLARGGGERLTVAEAAARTGIAPETLEMLLRAAGLPPPGPTDRLFSEEAARSMRSAIEAESLFGPLAVRRFVQGLGATLARAAESAVTLGVRGHIEPLLRGGSSPVALADARYRLAAAVRSLAAMMAQLFLMHVEVASQRLRPAWSGDVNAIDAAPLAVGFVDLVGFTPLAQRMDARALAEFIDGFEEAAHDVAQGCGGRIVKFIGDAVMFVGDTTAVGSDLALALVERFADEGTVAPRGGVAAGPVLLRGGDYYGPTVNLAARLAEQAVPGEILVNEDIAAGPGPTVRVEPAGRRLLKGFGAPVRVFAVERVPARGT